MKSIGKKKEVASTTKPPEPVAAPAPRQDKYRYEPYRKANPTPEPEGNRPADSKDLESLDVTAKMIYKSDREILTYIEALNHRTAAILEHVNRTGSQLRSCEVIMEKIELSAGQSQRVGDRSMHQQLLADGSPWKGLADKKAVVLGSHEEHNVPSPDLFPTSPYSQNGSVHTVKEHLSKNVNGLDLSYYAQSIHSESAPQSPYNYTEDDLFRPETPPLRQPSLPPGHEDENAVEYAEDMLEMRSDFSAPPDHAALASDDSTFNRTGADLRIASDTGLLFPPSDQEFARITKEFKREAMDTAAALAMRPSSSVPCSLRPLAQSYIPSSSPGPILQSESQHLVSPRPVLHTPPPRIGLNRKRKRLSTPEDEEDNNAGNIAGPITSVAQFNGDVPLRVKAEKPDERSPVKRRRLLTRQPSQDSQMFLAAGYAGSHDDGIADKRLDLISRQPSWDSQMFLEAGYAPPPPANPPTDGNPIEPSRGRSEGGIKPTAIIPAGLRVSQCSLPALIVGDNRATSMENAQLRLETPVKSQIPVGASGLVPGDVFGPVVFSAKASKISDRFPAERSKKDVDGTAMSDSERDGAEVEAESRDTVKPLCSPKKKRGTGARARKQKAIPSVEPDPTINPEDGLSSISASKRPLKLRRGRSAAVQPEDPLSKVPVRKSTRRRK